MPQPDPVPPPRVVDHPRKVPPPRPGGNPRRRVRKACKHCGQVRTIRRRGLCWTCYHDPRIRPLHKCERGCGRRGIADFNGRAGLPEPTDAAPGSLEKVAVLERRARLGQALWHPRDAKMDRPMDRSHLGMFETKRD